MRVLVLNAGSTSIKAALFDGASRRSLDGEGGLDRLGEEIWDGLAAVGHRVVHGGERFVRPTRVTGEVLSELRALAPYDPTHLPRQIALIEEIARRRPGLPQVACFDTAFHAGLPAVARLLPLPRRLAQRGVRRFGFHGLSYQFLLSELERQEGPAAARGRLVLAHLGGGASLAAVRDGRSVDTTMGFSPSGGIPMGTRSGDIDPGVVAYLAGSEGMDAQAVSALCAERSGLLGLSETTGDLRQLLERAPSDGRAAEAVALFCQEVKKRIGAFAAVLGGLDRLVFTGGIGQHSAEVRARACEGLEFLGIALAPERNAAHGPLISRGPVPVQVMATDEERMVFAGVREVLEQERKR
jgi:acetate kinase